VVGLGIVASDLLCFEDFVVSLFSGTSHLSKMRRMNFWVYAKR